MIKKLIDHAFIKIEVIKLGNFLLDNLCFQEQKGDLVSEEVLLSMTTKKGPISSLL